MFFLPILSCLNFVVFTQGMLENMKSSKNLTNEEYFSERDKRLVGFSHQSSSWGSRRTSKHRVRRDLSDYESPGNKITDRAIYNLEQEMSTKIIGGTIAREKGFPYQLYFSELFDIVCGATLVDVWGIHVAVTAAHCTWPAWPDPNSKINPDRVLLTGGTVNLNTVHGNEQTRRAVKIVDHDHYDHTLLINDISLIFPDSNFDISEYVASVRLPEKDWQLPDWLILTGWGSIADNHDYSDELYYVVMGPLPQDYCVQFSSHGHIITDKHFCILTHPGGPKKGHCYGDSGGPLLGVNTTNGAYLAYLAGVISYAVSSCGSEIYPGVETRVASFTEWIIDEVEKYRDEQTTRLRMKQLNNDKILFTG